MTSHNWRAAAATLLCLLVGHTFATPPFQLPDYEGIALEPLQPIRPHAPPTSANAGNYRLPGDLKPIFYELRMLPVLRESPPDAWQEMEPFTIEGVLTLTFEAVRETNVIVLNGKNVQVPDILSIFGSDGSTFESEPAEIDAERQMIIIKLAADSTGSEPKFVLGVEYTIVLQFYSQISHDLVDLSGAYLSQWPDPVTGNQRELLATQFQPTKARAMFPCFDEPAYKAEFKFVVGVAHGRTGFYKPLSNVELDPEEPPAQTPGFTLYTFKKTPVMSTYLLAMIISDFISEDAPEGAFRIPIKVWGPPPLIAAGGGKHAAETKPKLMTFYENLTGIPYELSKLDSVALPHFSAGAMENWGINTYRTEYLLHIPGESTQADRKKITQVLSHEITHQWYGNLITCEWWTETWLNEGFARFLQYRGMQHAVPDLVDEAAIVSDAVQLALSFDQGTTSRPVITEVQGPYDAEDVFDRISYEKAASLLRMLESILSKDVFDLGIRQYLRDNQHGTVLPEDLWTALQSMATNQLPKDVTIAQIMQSWTTLPGYPIVKASIAGPNKFVFTQEKFITLQGSTPPADEKIASLWYIPISAISESSPNVGTRAPRFWIPDSTPLLTRTDLNTSEWNVFNAEVAGYYRVLYDTQQLQLIKSQLESDHQVFTSATRSQLMEDYFQFANHRYVPVETTLELASYLGKETHLSVWTPVVPHLKSYINSLAWNSKALEAFTSYFWPRIDQVLNTIGWQAPKINETGATTILRAQLFDVAVALNDSVRKAYARELFQQFILDPVGNRSVIPVDLRPSVFCAGIEQADLETWSQMLGLWKTETYFWTQNQMLKALSCSADPAILTHYIHQAENKASGLDLLTTLKSVAQNTVGQQVAYNYVEQKLKAESTPENGRLLTGVLTTLGAYWFDNVKVAEVTKLLQEYDHVIPSSTAQPILNKLSSNVRWWDQFARNMVNFMATRS